MKIHHSELSELSDHCRTTVGHATVGLSDYCRTTVGITVGSLSELSVCDYAPVLSDLLRTYCRTVGLTVGLSDGTVGPGLCLTEVVGGAVGLR
jgi:hypothetical protein